jgi:hypothetical protein
MDRYINEALKVYEQRQKSYLNKAERGGNAAGALNQGRTIKTPPGNKQFFATIQGKQVKASPYQIREWNKNTTEEQRNDPNFLPEYAKTIISQGGRSTASIMREQGKVWNQKLRRYVDGPKKTEAPKTTTGATTKPKTGTTAKPTTGAGPTTYQKPVNEMSNEERAKLKIGDITPSGTIEAIGSGGSTIRFKKPTTSPTTKPTAKPKTTTPKPKPATPKAKPAAKPKTNTKKETPAAKPEAKPKTKPATGGFVTEDMLETKSQPTIKALQIRNERLYVTGEITKSDYLLTRLRIERVAKAKKIGYKGALPDPDEVDVVSCPTADQTKEGQATTARLPTHNTPRSTRTDHPLRDYYSFGTQELQSGPLSNAKLRKSLLKLRKERFQYEERLRDDSDPIKRVEPKHTGEGSNYVGAHGRKLGGRKEALAAAATGRETTNRGVKRRNNSSGSGLSIADRLRRDKE